MAKGHSSVPIRRLFGIQPFRMGEVTGESLDQETIQERRRQHRFAMRQIQETERKAREYDRLVREHKRLLQQIQEIVEDTRSHPGTQRKKILDLVKKPAA